MQFAWLLMRCGKPTHFEKITHIEIFSKCVKSETKSAYYAKKKKSNCVKNVHQDT